MFLLMLPNPNTAFVAPAFRRRRRETVVRNIFLFFRVGKPTTGFVLFYEQKIAIFFSKIRLKIDFSFSYLIKALNGLF